MSSHTRRLKYKEIEEYLLEDIPSGSESICDDENDEEDREDEPNSLVLGDFIGEAQVHDYDSFDSDDDLPLSSSVRQNPDSTNSNIAQSNKLTTIAPKWKKNYRMDIPGEFLKVWVCMPISHIDCRSPYIYTLGY
ncbi:uncharacterized protein [Eurosta solidaginis]|uniref:uncharacterized protein n=1 Tax=Eurosta solidaginis TaxID=178769 RepID=UPI003530A6E3